MNRHRARVTRTAKRIAHQMRGYTALAIARLEIETCSPCEEQSCQGCNALVWLDNDLEQEFWFQVQRYSPLVQERAGKLCGMRVYDPFSLPR